MRGLSSNPATLRSRPPSEPKTLHALTVDDTFLPEITRSTQWSVHSIFRRTVNIVSADEVLLTIANHPSTPAPYTLVCSASKLDELGIHRGAQVDYTSRGLTIGNEVAISMDGARTTSSVVTARPGDRQALSVSCALLDEQLRALGHTGSFFVARQGSPVDREIHRRLHEGREAVRRSILEPDTQQATAAACRSMLGLGIGLTPSGDDYLVGFLTAHLANECAAGRARELARVAAATVPSVTNAISAAAVLAAAHGRARQELSDVVHAAFDGTAAQLGSALDALLDIGSTSGTDMAVGVLDALHVMLELKEA